MIKQPFSLQQATALCARFRSLAGKRFFDGNDKGNIIECVSIAPFDEINKWMFVQFYAECRCPNKALAYYQYPFYDILVLAAKNPNSKQVHFKDIRQYLHPAPKTGSALLQL